MTRINGCRAAKSGTYATGDIARAELRRIRDLSTRAVKPIRAYPCTLGCKAWHLTSQPLRQHKAKRRR